MKLVISLATRNRPAQVVNTISRSLKNIVLPNTVLMVQVDDDDRDTIHALARAPWNDDRVQINVASREDTVAAKWNRALSCPADVYLVVGDDDPYVTAGYDARILEAASLFDDGIGMVYGHMANLTFSCLVAPTAKLCELMGNVIQPEYFPYWFCDHWTDDLAKLIGRISYTDVRTDQSKVGKTQEMREPGWWATWFDAAYLMRRRQAHDIINSSVFQASSDTKKRLCQPNRFVQQYSRWVNESVRANERDWTAAGMVVRTADARYQRVKDKAIAMIPHLLDDYGMDAGEAARFRDILTPPTQVVALKRAFA